MIEAIIGAVVSLVVGLATVAVDAVNSAADREQNQSIANQQAQIAQQGKQTDLQMNQQNIEMQKEINEANIANQNQQNAIMRAREDNAIQRRANDLQAAGINPLLAGLQGASAQQGGLVMQQAPIADTSIGSRFASNMIDILNNFGAREQERRRRTTESIHEVGRQTQGLTGQLIEIVKTKEELNLLKAQYNNLNADTKKKFEEIIKIQKEVEEKTVNISKTKVDTEYIKEMITSEPLKRALLKAQTREHYENIKMFQQKILNMKEERVNEVIRQTELLQKIEIDKELKTKIQKEVEILMIQGDIMQFERDMQKLDKVTSTSRSYVDMFTQIIGSIWKYK